MNYNENQSSLLNGDKTKDNVQSVTQRLLNEAEKETINHALATQFPEWDLKPPANLIKRRRTKLI